MRDFASRGGFTLMKTPSHRRQALRRRLLAVGGAAALALAAGVIGWMTARSPTEIASVQAETGPFSYFPSE